MLASLTATSMPQIGSIATSVGVWAGAGSEVLAFLAGAAFAAGRRGRLAAVAGYRGRSRAAVGAPCALCPFALQ